METNRLKRRDLLKGTAALAVTAPVLGLGGTAAAAAAALPGPRWIFFGPDPTTGLVVNWSSGSASSVTTAPPAPQVRYGPTTGYGTIRPATAARVPVPAGYGEPAQDTWYLSAALTGLQPGTVYHYSVSNDGRSWTAGAPFTTAAVSGAFRFTAFGDEAASAARAIPMAQLAASLSPAFHLVAGDLAYATPDPMKLPDVAGYNPAQWDAYLKAVGPAAAQSIPWQASVGAHEIEPLARPGYAGFTTRFPYPADLTSGSPVVRAFTYANTAFIHLDGNDLSAQETLNTGYTAGVQTSWLAARLAGYRAAGSGIDFIVVIVNCSCYSSNTEHGSDGGLRDVWGPLFDDYQVDLVISGHVHAYERTNPMIAGQPSSQVPSGGTVNSASQGTTYICAGGGGNGLYGKWYGTTLGGDAGSTTAPGVWRWSGGDTALGGTGTARDVQDTAAGYSAFRQAAFHCLCVDVTPAAGGRPAAMLVRALRPAQTASSVTSITSPAVMDSVTIIR
jgi:Purple acid Phosphatase, N-terminal domain/Calcineurin-like phosphoesterase